MDQFRQEEDIKRILETGRRLKEIDERSEITAGLQLLLAQPYVYSSITGMREYTSDSCREFSPDSALEEMMRIGDEDSERGVLAVFDRAYQLFINSNRLQEIVTVLSPIVVKIQGKSLGEIDDLFAEKTMYKDKSKFGDRERAIGLEIMLGQYQSQTEPVFLDLTSVLAAKKILQFVWEKLNDPEALESLWRLSLEDSEGKGAAKRLQSLFKKMSQDKPERLEKLLTVISSPLVRDALSDTKEYSFIWEMPIFQRRSDGSIAAIDVQKLPIGNRTADWYRSGNFPHIHKVSDSDFWMIKSGGNLYLTLQNDVSSAIKPEIVAWNKAFLLKAPKSSLIPLP